MAIDVAAAFVGPEINKIPEHPNEGLALTIHKRLVNAVVTSAGNAEVRSVDVNRLFLEVGGVMDNLLTRMKSDKDGLINRNVFVSEVGQLSKEESALAEGYYLAALLGMNLVEEDPKEPLIVFLHQATRMAQAQGESVKTKLATKLKFRGDQVGITEGTTVERTMLIWSLAKNIAECQPLSGELPYYLQETYLLKGGENLSRRLWEPKTAQHRGLEEIFDKETAAQEKWDKKWENRTPPPGEKRPNRSVYTGSKKVCPDDLLIWFCLGKYGDMDRNSGLPIKRSYETKMEGIRNKLKGWLGKKEEE